MRSTRKRRPNSSTVCFGIDGLEQLLEAAEIALLRANLVGEIGEPHAGPRRREVDIVLRRHFDQAGFRRDRLEIAPLLGLRVRVGVRDLDADRPENADVARLAADGGQLGVERRAMLLHAGKRAARAELQVGIGRGQVHAGPRQSGLDDDRPVLRRRQRRQRAAHVEIAPAISRSDALWPGSQKMPFSRSAISASGSTLSHSAHATLRNSCARS